MFKYQLGPNTQQHIEMPAGAKLLWVHLQYGGPTLWALVDDERPKELRELGIFGTGEPLPAERPHVGSFQLMGGSLVFHVFDMGSQPL